MQTGVILATPCKLVARKPHRHPARKSMPPLSRRELFKNTAAATSIPLTALSLRANPLGMPLGCQTYPVRTMIAADFPGTIRQLASAGFQTVELCSPKGYAKAGFAGLAQYKGPELTKLLGDLNVTCHSSHFNMRELRDDLPASIAWAEEVGLSQMMVPSLGCPLNPTMDDVKRLSNEFNNWARQTSEAGLQLGLHNEGFELSTIDRK